MKDDFFKILRKKLAKMSNVSEMQRIPRAFVPIMKFKFDKVEIDMVYVSICLPTIPQVLNTNYQ